MSEKESESLVSAKLVYIETGKVILSCRCTLRWPSNNLTQIINIHKKHYQDIQTKAMVLIEGWFCLQGNYLAISENIFGCYNWKSTIDIYRLNPRDAANHLIIHRTASHRRNSPHPNTMLILRNSELMS